MLPTALALLLAVAAADDGGIALTISTPDQNVRHREIVAGLVEALRQRHAFLQPALPVDDVALCRGEVPCVRELATRHGARWLLMVGVAGVGPRDAVVSIALVGPDGAVVVDDNAVVRGSAAPRQDGAALAPRLLAVPGLPPAQVATEREPLPAPGPWQTPAAALVGGGAVIAGASVAVALGLSAGDATRGAALPVVVGGGLVGMGCAAVGAALVVGERL